MFFFSTKVLYTMTGGQEVELDTVAPGSDEEQQETQKTGEELHEAMAMYMCIVTFFCTLMFSFTFCYTPECIA